MLRLLRNAFEVSRSHLKGVYICKISKNQKGSVASPPAIELICTLHDGCDVMEFSDFGGDSKTTEYEPIKFTYLDTHAALRPWSPDACVISAAIHNRLIHFPVRPGSRVFALDCSLRTLSHIADIVGPTGRLIGVISKSQQQQPKMAEISRCFKTHPRVSIITEDVQNASLERYRRLLGLPEESKYAFLMALHPRLGQDSPARILTELGADRPKVVRKIFEFIDNGDAADMSCLIVCHWPKDARVDVIREVVLSHIDILQKFRTGKASRKSGDDATADSGPGGGENAASSSHTEQEPGGEATERKSKKRSSKSSKSDSALRWILLDLPTDRIASSNPSADISAKLTEVVDGMKKLRSGLRTGLFAKEQLMLMPHFPNHTLLVLKYSATRDERTRKTNRRSMPAPPGLDTSEADGSDARKARPPSSASLPVPAFATLGDTLKNMPPPRPDAGAGDVGAPVSSMAMSEPLGNNCGGNMSSSTRPCQGAAAQQWPGGGAPCGQRMSMPPSSLGQAPSGGGRGMAPLGAMLGQSGRGPPPGLGGNAGSDFEQFAAYGQNQVYGRDAGGEEAWDYNNPRWGPTGPPPGLGGPRAGAGVGMPNDPRNMAPRMWHGGGDGNYLDPGLAQQQQQQQQQQRQQGWQGQSYKGGSRGPKGAGKNPAFQPWMTEAPPGMEQLHFGGYQHQHGKGAMAPGPLQPGFVQNAGPDHQQYWA